MPTLKRWLDRARRLAEERLPGEVLDAGRRLRDTVLERAPAPIADAVARYVPRAEVDRPEAPRDSAPDLPQAAAEPTAREDAPVPDDIDLSDELSRQDPEAVLRRVHTKADEGLKPEDRLVVVYSTADEREAVTEIRRSLSGIEATIREMDLDREPQTAKQIAQLTGVMIPPYVFINGRYWGGQYEIASLAACGDLEHVVANRLQRIGDEAKRIGKIHESHSDEISVENILHRWKLGHILCVDDLDSWYEVDRDGTEHFYYQGGPRAVDEMPEVAQEIVQGVADEAFTAVWLLDPTVQIN